MVRELRRGLLVCILSAACQSTSGRSVEQIEAASEASDGQIAVVEPRREVNSRMRRLGVAVLAACWTLPFMLLAQVSHVIACACTPHLWIY